jgi:hypothetical protein
MEVECKIGKGIHVLVPDNTRRIINVADGERIGVRAKFYKKPVPCGDRFFEDGATLFYGPIPTAESIMPPLVMLSEPVAIVMTNQTDRTYWARLYLIRRKSG